MSWTRHQIEYGGWKPDARFVEEAAFTDALMRLNHAVDLLTRQSNYGKPGSDVNTLLPDIRLFLAEHKRFLTSVKE